MRVLALALLATGCTEFRWPGDDIALRPETTERLAPIAPRWRAEVETAAARWNLAAEQAGCAVRFRIDDGPDVHPVRLYLPREWPFDTDHVGETLGGPDGVIDVVDRWGTREGDNIPTLLHELGHALGLEHGPGVMAADVPALTEPTADDIAALAAGC